jgi:hypothetical protein
MRGLGRTGIREGGHLQKQLSGPFTARLGGIWEMFLTFLLDSTSLAVSCCAEI